ncbi:MAG: hypothetical protein ABI434_18290 [Burkholderiaceae bacterium]
MFATLPPGKTVDATRIVACMREPEGWSVVTHRRVFRCPWPRRHQLQCDCGNVPRPYLRAAASGTGRHGCTSPSPAEGVRSRCPC